MKTLNALARPAQKARSPWGALAAVAAVFLLGSSAAFAAAPPANSVIGNQASVSYLDPNGNAQVASSNLVQTTVQQVGSFTLDAQTTGTTFVANTKTGAAGAVVYAPHVLVNTGNGSDSFNIKVTKGAGLFSKIEIYADTNFDGLPDNATPLCSSTGTGSDSAGGCAIPAQTVAGTNGQYGFVVAYTIPPTATTPTTPYDLGNVTAAPVSLTVPYGTSNQTVSVIDNVNLTTVAAFNVSKAISQPSSGITAPSGSWPTAINNGKRSSSASCPTVWSSTLVSNNPNCVYTTYTVTYSNTGGAPGKFAMQDVIGTGATAGLAYVTGSAVWSNNPGSALGENGAVANGVALNWDSAANALTFVDNTVPVNNTRSVSFVVLVKSTALVGTSSTTNVVAYNPVDAGSATAVTAITGLSSNSNQPPFTVLGTYSIAVAAQTASTTPVGQDTVPGTPGTGATDTQTLASAPAGKSATYTHRVFNLGNDTDSVNMSVQSNTFPTGSVVTFYKIDGTTQLSDTNNDGKIDTGPIPTNGYVDIIVKVTIPPTATTAAFPPPYNLVILGTSGSDTTIKDAAADVLTTITGPLLDLTNTSAGSSNATSGDIGTGPSAAATTTANNVPAGSWTSFDLFLKNNDSGSNSYTLSASGTTTFPGTLPAGWTVKFVDNTTASLTAASCATASALSGNISPSVAAAGQGRVLACVFVPLTQVSTTQSVYFQARATAASPTDGSTPIDTIYDAVQVIAAAATYSATLTPNGSGQVAAGGSIVYAHLLTATGTGICGAPKVTVALPPADVAAGWTYAVYWDQNKDGTLNGTDVLVTDPTGALPSGAPTTIDPSSTTTNSIYLLVKLFAPGGAVAGTADVATVNVTFGAGPTGGICGTPSATNTTTVVTGQVRLLKTQSANTACDAAVGTQASTGIAIKPGQCVVYQVKATNEGTSSVTNLSISDVLPAYTSLNDASGNPLTQPTTTCASTGVTPAFANANFASTSTGVSCGSTANTVAPGGTATLTFQVRLNDK